MSLLYLHSIYNNHTHSRIHKYTMKILEKCNKGPQSMMYSLMRRYTNIRSYHYFVYLEKENQIVASNIAIYKH